jgi:hypothetical protein
MNKKAPFGVVCLWQYKEPTNDFDKCWEMVEFYHIDGDGYAITETKNIKTDNRVSWSEWINSKTIHDDGWEEYGSIKGRAVTLWTVESGVRLAEFNPPDYPKWLSSDCYEAIKKLPNWHSFIQDGYRMYGGTARIVENILDPQP